MLDQLRSVLSSFCQSQAQGGFSIFNASGQFDDQRSDKEGIARALNAAFLITLCGEQHRLFRQASGFLARRENSPEWGEIAKFYLNGVKLIHTEIETVCKNNPDFSHRLGSLSEWLANRESPRTAEQAADEQAAEQLWSVFFPEATGIRGHEKTRVEALRRKRTVTITELNPAPITNPAQQLLFTSNVLLTMPSPKASPHELGLSADLKEKLRRVAEEPQAFWYDHPIQMGVEPPKNEAIYGLRALQTAFDFERQRGTVSAGTRLTCVLSVSVTHRGLHGIARKYLEEELARAGGLKDIDVYVFTEADTQRLVDEVLAPAADRYLGRSDATKALGVFGVDGKYGRHYSFLKAMAAFWNILIQPEVCATFKIDLDQVFPQEELVEQTGASAFEHFKSPLWGARGIDANGQAVELGMIAGALVNAHDIGKSLFTPDVPFPRNAASPDEYVFFSLLPQALSTEAEMLTRYATGKLDGTKACIQRIHVTGGTTGILVERLRRFRPFTPSFIGRAEDQAYVLSVFAHPGPRLAYVHKAGLIMRHDKEAFAQESIQRAYVGKLIGDYLRILYFSAYAAVLADDMGKLKDAVDPFTGGFISRIPTTVVYLRFALKAAALFAADHAEQGLEFIATGAPRIAGAVGFVAGKNSMLKQQYEKERLGWSVYYDALAAVEKALEKREDFALALRKQAGEHIDRCRLRLD